MKFDWITLVCVVWLSLGAATAFIGLLKDKCMIGKAAGSTVLFIIILTLGRITGGW